MKKYLFLAMALLGMTSCAKDDLADGNKPIHGGEIEESYIAINLSASDITRAKTGFEDGAAEERAVNHADFFFFDEAGEPFNVTGNPATNPGGDGDINHLRAVNVTFSEDGNKDDDISDTSTPVLLLRTYKGLFPSQIVAVLNWSPNKEKSYSLDELQAAVNITGQWNEKDYFVMSNAVYAQNGKAVYATPLSYDNIQKNADDAKKVPVNIHVERIAAKVTVTAKDVVENNRFKVKKKDDDSGFITLGGINTDVYVQVTGWELYNDFTQSKLLKDINPAWDNSDLGFIWNDNLYHRCYWANSLTMGDIVSNAFPTTFSLGMGKTSDVNDGTYADNTYTYVGENTLSDEKNRTKVIIKAKLQKKNGEGYEDLELARWYATYYAGLEDLLTAVANTIKYQYYWLDEDSQKYVYIAPEDLTVKKVDNWVAFTLSTEAKDKNWYIRNGDAYDSKTDAEINALLANIEKALYYDNAETLYYVDIAHLGYALAGTHTGDYGVVRNHIYNVVLNSFGGLGSPVYVPEGGLTYPEDPTNTGVYVSAEVRVLSWRLVNQEVDIQPNN